MHIISQNQIQRYHPYAYCRKIVFSKIIENLLLIMPVVLRKINKNLLESHR